MKNENLPTVLVVNKDEAWYSLYRDALEVVAEVILVTNLEDGERIFRSQKNLFAVVVSSFANAGSDVEPRSLSLIRTIKREQPSSDLLLIGVSALSAFRQMMKDAGCTKTFENVGIPAFLLDELTKSCKR